MLLIGSLVLLLCIVMVAATMVFVLRCFRDEKGNRRPDEERAQRLLTFLVFWCVTGIFFSFFSTLWAYKGSCTLAGSTFQCGRLPFFFVSLIAMVPTWPFHMASYALLAVHGDSRLLLGAGVAVVLGLTASGIKSLLTRRGQ